LEWSLFPMGMATSIGFLPSLPKASSIHGHFHHHVHCGIIIKFYQAYMVAPISMINIHIIFEIPILHPIDLFYLTICLGMK
jgi:hypothetical protein